MISVPSAASLIWYSQELQLFLQMMVLEEEVFEIPRKVSEVGFFVLGFFFCNIYSKRFSFLLCFLAIVVSGRYWIRSPVQNSVEILIPLAEMWKISRSTSSSLLLLLSRFSHVRLGATPEMADHQAPPYLGFSRQEHWSGLPFPSPMHESEKWKWSRSVVSDSSRPHGLQPTRLLRPWDFPGKGTGVGCHCLLLILARSSLIQPPMTLSEKTGQRHPQVALVVKNSPANAGDERDVDLIPESGRSLGGGHGNPLQYSCQENPMDRGAWQATAIGLQIRHDWSDLACIHLPIPWRFSLSGKGSVPRLTLDRSRDHNLWTTRRSLGLTLASHSQLNHPAHLSAPWLLSIPLSIFYLHTALSCLFSRADFYSVFLFLTFLPCFLQVQVHSRPILSTPLFFPFPS